MDFKTDAELYQYLLDGGLAEYKDLSTSMVVKLKDGNLIKALNGERVPLWTCENYSRIEKNDLIMCSPFPLNEDGEKLFVIGFRAGVGQWNLNLTQKFKTKEEALDKIIKSGYVLFDWKEAEGG